MSETSNSSPENERVAASQPVQQVIEADDLEPLYANFARVSGLPEELILDFGLNPQACRKSTCGGQDLAASGRELLHREKTLDGLGCIFTAARTNIRRGSNRRQQTRIASAHKVVVREKRVRMDEPFLPWWLVLLLGMWAVALAVWQHPSVHREVRLWAGFLILVYSGLIFLALGFVSLPFGPAPSSAPQLQAIDLGKLVSALRSP